MRHSLFWDIARFRLGVGYQFTRGNISGAPYATRPKGRPRVRWEDDVRNYLGKMGVNNWKQTTQERKKWKEIIEQPKLTESCRAEAEEEEEEEEEEEDIGSAKTPFQFIVRR